MAQAATRTRHNRTITVDFRDEATYVQLLSDGKAFVECVLAFLLAVALGVTPLGIVPLLMLAGALGVVLYGARPWGLVATTVVAVLQGVLVWRPPWLHLPALPGWVSSSGASPHAPQRADGPCLVPDYSGGHVASSSPQRNRELPHGQTRAGAGATQRSHQAGRGPTAARYAASRSASRIGCQRVCWPAAAVSTRSAATAAAW
jgi:hypothetical protein